MTLNSMATVAIFLLFIAPGLISTILAARHRGDVPQSSFREFGSTFLFSLIYTSTSTFLVVGALLLSPILSVPELNRLASEDQYLRSQAFHVALVLLAISAFSCGLAGVAHFIRFRKSTIKSHDYSGWYYAFEDRLPPGAERHVSICLKNDYIYSGMLASYSDNHKLSDREIVLAPPFHIQSPPDKILPDYEKWKRVVIRGDEIAALGVRYKKRRTKSATNTSEKIPTATVTNDPGSPL